MALVHESRSKRVVTTTQAGQMLSASRATVIEMCKSGEFQGAYRVGTHWRIPVEDVEGILNPHSQPGSDHAS